MTRGFCNLSSQLAFQLTSSRGGWLIFSLHPKTTIVFQLTSSRGGWLYSLWIIKPYHIISTHILTRRMTIPLEKMKFRNTFQLTSSRGGWLPTTFAVLNFLYFNSHPHEEDDFDSRTRNRRNIISTHILTRRMTPRYFRDVGLWVFQLTSSRGGWLTGVIDYDAIQIISTHILTRRMT